MHSLQFADNVGWRTTTSFIFPQHNSIMKLYLEISAFEPFLALGPFSKRAEACGPVIHFSRFLEGFLHLLVSNRFWHFSHFPNAQRHVAQLYFFLVFMCDLKKKYQSKF